MADQPIAFYWEDIPLGPIAAVREGRYHVTEAEILDYGRTYNPQPFHADPEAAKDSFYGGVIASGWHVCAMMMRLLCDGFLLRAASRGAPGIDEIRWLAPVRPGDTLRLELTCLEKRASQSKADLGICRFRYQVFNQRDEEVAVLDGTVLFGRRPQGEAGR